MTWKIRDMWLSPLQAASPSTLPCRIHVVQAAINGPRGMTRSSPPGAPEEQSLYCPDPLTPPTRISIVRKIVVIPEGLLVCKEQTPAQSLTRKWGWGEDRRGSPAPL